MVIRIRVFAAMKDHFAPEFALETLANDIRGLRQALSAQCPSADALLATCRFAVDDEYVDDSFALLGQETVLVLPPVSGG